MAVNFIDGGNWGNHRLAASHWQTLSQCCIEYTLSWALLIGRFWVCIKCAYYHSKNVDKFYCGYHISGHYS